MCNMCAFFHIAKDFLDFLLEVCVVSSSLTLAQTCTHAQILRALGSVL